MIMHQSIYGDRSGSYSLLKTSMTDTDHAKRICNVTDLIDRPSNGYLTRPVFRGFAFNDLYLFIKTFPDIDPAVRQGRVLSHALIVKQSDLDKFNDVSALIPHFISEPDKSLELKPITLNAGKQDQKAKIESATREAFAVNGLLDHAGNKNTLIWIGEEGYLDFVAKIWGCLSPNLRSKLKVGIGFNPPKEEPQTLCILYVLEEYGIKWRGKGFCIVDKDSVGTLGSFASFLIAGHKDKAQPLIEMINNFGIVINDVDDYCYLETVVNLYKTIDGSTEFNRLIVLCDLISKYSPNNNIGRADKNKILKHVLSRIGTASAKQILILKNPEWIGFFDAHKLIGEQISQWVMNSLLTLKLDVNLLKLLSSVFDPRNNAIWWKNAILTSLQKIINAWLPGHATVVWNWFIIDNDLVDLLDGLIADAPQIENDLVDAWPNPSQSLAKKLLAFAKSRGWLTLHGICLLKVYNAAESLKIQLAIDTDPHHINSLVKMSTVIDNTEFVRLAIKVGEIRLLNIAGELITKNASLMRDIDVTNVYWRHIWLQCVRSGNDPWDGISEPYTTLFSLLEQVIHGSKIDSELLFKLSNSRFNDLSAFKLRADVWQCLGYNEKSGFLQATALGCVRLIDQKLIEINELEREIRTKIIEPTCINQILRDQLIGVATKIMLFEALPELGENDLLALVKSHSLGEAESKKMGHLIHQKHWKKAAKELSKLVTSRLDCVPALMACKSLLGFFDRLGFSFNEVLSESISKEEWWSALTEQCFQKYPGGPMQNGLWERVGGKQYDLLSTGTGREIWVDAITQVQKGVSVDIIKLLDAMIKEFSFSTELKQLKQSYRWAHAK